MSSPYKGEGRGIAMLHLLRTLSQSIVPTMASVWEQEIPLLIQYLEGEVPTSCVRWAQVARRGGGGEGKAACKGLLVEGLGCQAGC